MTNFNERMHTLLYKNIYISHTLFSKGLMLVVGERWAVDGDRLLYWPSSTFFLILAGLLNRGSLRAQSPLSATVSNTGILSPTDVFFKIPKFLAHHFWAWRHSLSSHISYLGFIMTIMIVISSVRERKLYPINVCAPEPRAK